MGSIEKKFIKPREGNDDQRTNTDGVHRQGQEGLYGQRTFEPGGEVADPNDPESILIAKEEKEAAEAADKGMTLKQYHDWQKGQEFKRAA